MYATLFVAVLTLLAEVTRGATSADTWTRLYPRDPVGPNAMGFANGKFYLSAPPLEFKLPSTTIQKEWTLYSSTNGAKWTREPGSAIWTNHVRSMTAFGDDIFLALSWNGEAAWLRRDGSIDFVGSVGPSSIFSIAAHKGEYFATLWGETNMLRSTDGRSWSLIAAPAKSFHIASGADVLVVSGEAGKIFRSSDSADWEEIAAEVSGFSTLTYAGGMFLGGTFDAIVTSTDGREWTRTSIPIQQVMKIVYGGGRFVAAGSFGTAMSIDGITWSVTRRNFGLGLALAYGNGLWVLRSQGGQTFVSTDGLQWNGFEPPGGDFRDLISWRDLTIGAASSVIILPDFQSFTNSVLAFGYYNSLAYTESNVVAVTSAGKPAYSTNGVEWFTGSGKGMVGVARGDKQFIGLTGANSALPDEIQKSADGITWADGAFPVSQAQLAIAFGGGKFVVSGRGGLIHSSPDGDVWTRENSGVTNDISSISFANGLFIATGPQGLLLTSPNGSEWTQRDSHTTNTLAKATYGHGVFVVVGEGGVVLTSLDSMNWTGPRFVSEESLYAVVALPDRFLAAGDFGTLVVSGYFGPTRFETVSVEGPSVELKVQAEIGRKQRIESRVALDSGEWVAVGKIDQTNEVQTVSLPIAAAEEQRFYRIVEE